jgi:hypothetical protein
VGYAGLRHFFFDAGEGFFVEFFFSLLRSHVAHHVIKTKEIQVNLEQVRNGTSAK